MMNTVDHVFFDVGGVLGTNGWDREQRHAAVVRFGLDADDFQYRHEETVGAFESGAMSLEEYLEFAVFHRERRFSHEEFRSFMLTQSQPFPASIAVARGLSENCSVNMMTLNNEAAELNRYRIQHFGLRPMFSAFFTSCWLGVRKPSRGIYERALEMAQADPRRTIFVDDREQNLTTARTLGMRTILFRGAEQLAMELEQSGLNVGAWRQLTSA